MRAAAFVISSVTCVRICSLWAHNLSLNKILFLRLHLHCTIMQQDPCCYARVLLLKLSFVLCTAVEYEMRAQEFIGIAVLLRKETG